MESERHTDDDGGVDDTNGDNIQFLVQRQQRASNELTFGRCYTSCTSTGFRWVPRARNMAIRIADNASIVLGIAAVAGAGRSQYKYSVCKFKIRFGHI